MLGAWMNTDPGDLLLGLVMLVAVAGLGLNFVQSITEGMFHE